MIIIILAIGLLILFSGITLMSISGYGSGFAEWIYHNEWSYCWLNVIGTIITVIALVATLALIYECSTEKAIDSKITMYQEENQQIETTVAEAVKNYQDYEKQTFSELSPKEIMVAISLYPELKSNELVLEQIQIYTSNNDKIKELKANKIDITTSRWWLYFGK